MTRLEDEDTISHFVTHAAKFFAKSDKHKTFTLDGKITEGCLFGIRWGLDSDCVVVVRISEDFEPINYQNIISDLKPMRSTF